MVPNEVLGKILSNASVATSYERDFRFESRTSDQGKRYFIS